jgi:hypothetical protein
LISCAGTHSDHSPPQHQRLHLEARVRAWRQQRQQRRSIPRDAVARRRVWKSTRLTQTTPHPNFSCIIPFLFTPPLHPFLFTPPSSTVTLSFFPTAMSPPCTFKMFMLPAFDIMPPMPSFLAFGLPPFQTLSLLHAWTKSN